MKGIPIKFRAKCIETGDFITFELGECSAELRDDYLTVIKDEVYTILADTICQLVGYDDNGAEVYEGDKVQSAELDYFAALEPRLIIPNITGFTVPFLYVTKTKEG